MQLDETNIMLELHRIAQRQFPWQRGFVKPQNAYRFLYVYGQGKCADHFAAKHGITITNFVVCAFAFFWATYNNPVPLTPISDSLNPAMIEAALKVIALSPEVARLKAREMRKIALEKNGGKELSRTIYQPSVLREFPIVRVGRNLIAPLPDLIMYRATSGLFFDIVGNGQELINDANQRFEEYARLLIKSHMPRFEVLEAQLYRFNKSEAQTPDVLVS